MPYCKTSDDIKICTKFLDTQYKKVSRKMRTVCIDCGITAAPKCIITGAPAHFTGYSFEEVCTELFQITKYDKQVTSPPLRWLHFMKCGASFDELFALIHSKGLYKVRNAFRFCVTPTDFIDRLVDNGFTLNRANSIINNVDFSSWKSILQFIDFYNIVSSHRNTSLDYYLARGQDEQVAKELQHTQCNTVLKMKVAHLSDPLRKERWLESRMKGLKSQKRISKFENILANELAKKHKVQQQCHVKSANVGGRQFLVDIIVDDELIVEYYGSWWHKDMLKYANKFGMDDYLPQILKLKYIHETTKKNVLVIWEQDVKDTSHAIQLVELALHKNLQFSSSRNFDIDIYDTLVH